MLRHHFPGSYTLQNNFAGLISATFKSKINKFFHKAHRRGLVTTVFDIQGLIDIHDTHLFGSITYTDHCLHYLLPENSIVQWIPGTEDTNTHLATSQPPTLRIPLSIDVCLAWSSSLCFIICLLYTSHLLRIDIWHSFFLCVAQRIVCLYVIIILLYDLTLLRCKTCAIDIGSLKATYLLTYLLTYLHSTFMLAYLHWYSIQYTFSLYD